MMNCVRRCLPLSLAILLTMTLFGCQEMTEEERAQWLAERTNTYEVLSVSQYTKPVTNNFGGVIRTEVCYTFSYIDGNGELCIEDDFQHFEYGLTKICLGEADQYVTVSRGDTYRYLYLTKETIQNMGTIGGVNNE